MTQSIWVSSTAKVRSAGRIVFVSALTNAGVTTTADLSISPVDESTSSNPQNIIARTPSQGGTNDCFQFFSGLNVPVTEKDVLYVHGDPTVKFLAIVDVG